MIGCSPGGDVSSLAPDPISHIKAFDTTWKLDEATWRRITVDPYRALHAEYVREFDASVPALQAQIKGNGALEIRDHFADDPQLTRGQARTRWALPVMAKAIVATRGRSPIDAVFLEDGGRWYAIVGLDRVVTAHVARLDPACAARIDAPTPSLRCRSVSWQVADAALRTDRERFAHACSLAATLCGTASP